MKKSVLAIVLVFAAVAAGQDAASQQPAQPASPQAQPAPGQPGAPAQPAAPAAPQKKEIKDPAEYNAYVGAVQQQDPNAKISGLEAFLTQYPNSVMKEDALELLMTSYQQTGNQAKVIEAANRVLQANPNNVRALVLLAYNERAAQKWADAKQHAEHGVQAVGTMAKPDGMSDPDFAKQKAQFGGLLNSIAGFSALQLKDYPSAQKYLRAAVEADPNNLENIYPLALAYLSAAPPDDLNGLFFIARAASLIQDPKAKADVVKFGHSRYMKYHGAEDGWNELLAQTATTTLPPTGFAITQYVPPTPAQQAHDLVKDKAPDQIKRLSFAEWELVLSAGSPEDQDKVWSVIKGVPLQMGGGRVITTSPTKLELAASVDDIDQKRADIELTMAAALPAKLVPKEGSDIDFEGTPVSYTASPFVMVMEKGALLTRAAPTPAKKPPVRRKPGA